MNRTDSLCVFDPASGEEIARLQRDSAADIAHKVVLARAARDRWAYTDAGARRAALLRFAQLLGERREELARTLTSEVGKPIAQARAEIAATGERIGFFVENAAAATAEESVWDDPAAGLRERITYDPLGAIANISAWNYPYFVGVNVFAPALLTGNTVLYKPSEHATLTGLAIARLLHEAGVPPDVMIPIVGAGDAGARLLEQPIDGVFFTGSYATGSAVATAAARRLLPAQLELGGKDPAYVCDDVSIAAAAASLADGAFYNTGQSCCAVERIYVHRAAYDSFVEAFVARVRAFRVGDPADEDTYIGPLTRPAQVGLIEAQVRDAVARGARLLCGGERIEGPGNFFAPTVLIDVDHRMAAMRDESFGPVIGIQPAADDDEAARLMSDTEYGLTAGVYSRDEERARRILQRVGTGSSYWNCCDRVSPRLPWSGRGHSGLGVTLGRQGIRSFVRPRAWHLKSPDA